MYLKAVFMIEEAAAGRMQRAAETVFSGPFVLRTTIDAGLFPASVHTPCALASGLAIRLSSLVFSGHGQSLQWPITCIYHWPHMVTITSRSSHSAGDAGHGRGSTGATPTRAMRGRSFRSHTLTTFQV